MYNVWPGVTGRSAVRNEPDPPTAHGEPAPPLAPITAARTVWTSAGTTNVCSAPVYLNTAVAAHAGAADSASAAARTAGPRTLPPKVRGA
jgi:hypothetical protein